VGRAVNVSEEQYPKGGGLPEGTKGARGSNVGKDTNKASYMKGLRQNKFMKKGEKEERK